MTASVNPRHQLRWLKCLPVSKTLYKMPRLSFIVVVDVSGVNSRHTPSRALTACQLLNHPRLRTAASASPEPHDVIKAPDPYALSGAISASPDPCNVSAGAPKPLGVLLPRPRDAWSPLVRREAMGPPPRRPSPPIGRT
jgi:hypothetical protein